jgi:hypothetical protein
MKINERMILTEGSRDKALEQFIPLFQSRGIQVSISQLKQALLEKFVNEAGMHNLSLGGNYYLLGTARYYFNGDLTGTREVQLLNPDVKDNFNEDVCQRLNALILILRDAYIDSVGTTWEQPEDFGTLRIDELFRKYGRKIKRGVENDVSHDESGLTTKRVKLKNYTYDILYSYEEARKYNRATSPGAWCITYGQQHYNNYIKMNRRYGGIHYVVFRQNGYENIPRVEEKDKWLPGPKGLPKPQDAYGNSLICVLQRNDCPEPTYITSRWNHGSGFSLEADYAYTKREFLNVIGADESILQQIYNEWKENYNSSHTKSSRLTKAVSVPIIRAFKYAQMQINSGADPFKLKFIEVLNLSNIQPQNDGGKLNPNGMYLIKAENNGVNGYTLMSKKTLFFNDFFIGDTDKENNLSCEPIRNCVVFEANNGRNHMIFDRIRNRFLNIDDINTFGRVYSSPNGKYIATAADIKQLTLIKTDTMKPVRINNGSCWFEGIITLEDMERMYNVSQYARNPSVDSVYVNLNAAIVRLVYDSSAGKEYFYSLQSDRFVDIGGAPKGFRISGRQYSYTLPVADCICFEKKDKDGKPVYSYKKSDGTWFTINGISKFNGISRSQYCTSMLSFAPERSKKQYYYDVAHDKVIEFNGKPLSSEFTDYCSEPYIVSNGGYFVYYIEDGRSIMKTKCFKGVPHFIRDIVDPCLVYYPNTGTFFQDDVTLLMSDMGGFFNGFYYFDKSKIGLLKPSDTGRGVRLKRGAKNLPLKERKWFHPIPTAEEMVNGLEEGYRRIHGIIMETLFRELKKLI